MSSQSPSITLQHHTMLLPVRTGLDMGTLHHELPSLEQSGLRSYLGSTHSRISLETVPPVPTTRPITQVPGHVIDVSAGTMSTTGDVGHQADEMQQSPHQYRLSPDMDTPLNSTCNSPRTVHSRLESLDCSSSSGDSTCSIGSSASRGSPDRLMDVDSHYRMVKRQPKRRRGAIPASGPRTMVLPADLNKPFRPKISEDVKKEKRFKEQDARNGQKEQVREMEELVTRYWGCDGMTELNQNNSKASGLKYKKVEVYNGAVSLIKALLGEIAGKDRVIDDLSAKLGARDDEMIKELEAELGRARRTVRWMQNGNHNNNNNTTEIASRL